MANRRSTRTSKRKTQQGSLRDTLKVLAFAQLVLLFCAGAIPEPFKLFAFAPVGAALGAGAFWAVATGIGFVQAHAKLSTGAVQPASVAAAPRTRTRPTKVVKISKIA